MIYQKDFLKLSDFTRDEIRFLLDESKRLKDLYKKRISPETLKHKTLGMIFQKRSTRTRVSVEVAMNFLGGHALFLSMSDIQLGANETLKDTALVLSRFVDGILARVYGHDDLEELALHASIPVINALSDKYHPMQILADFLTVEEKFGKLEGLKAAWVGDGNNVCHSWMLGSAIMGIDLIVATPEKYKPAEDVMTTTINLAQEYGTSFKWTSDPVEAVKDADIVITDTFVSMGQEKEKEQRIKDFQGFQVNKALVEHASPEFVFMHCLPRKPHEVTDEIFYGPHSIVFDEAENRLHTAMAILNTFLR